MNIKYCVSAVSSKLPELLQIEMEVSECLMPKPLFVIVCNKESHSV